MPAYAVLASAFAQFRRFGLVCLDRLSSPAVSLVLCYAAGLLAMRSLCDEAAPVSMAGLAAAAVAGLVVRYGRGLDWRDALSLGAVRLAFGAAVGEDPASAGLGLALDLASIWCASGLFAVLRRGGFVSSQTRVIAALGLVAAAIGAVQATPHIAAFASGAAGALEVAAGFVMSSLGALLITTLSLAFDRADRRIGGGVEEAPSVAGEAVAAAALLAIIVGFAIFDGRQEIALAASAALMWFAVRLGLFATSLASFLLVAALAAFGSGAEWRALTGADAGEANLLRALAFALLSLPSLAVAAVTHDHRSARRDLAFRAFHDGLTTLANRSRFLETLQGATDGARAKGRRFALFLVDLDHFKAVNDSFGHASGDALLVEVSTRLRDTVRATDMVARLGGDEFAVIAPVPTAEDATRLAGRLVASIDRPFVQNGLELRPSITVGVALAPDSSVDPERLMAIADHALYEAKAAGRNCWRMSSSDAIDAFAVDWNAEDREPKAQIVYLD